MARQHRRVPARRATSTKIGDPQQRNNRREKRKERGKALVLFHAMQKGFFLHEGDDGGDTSKRHVSCGDGSRPVRKLGTTFFFRFWARHKYNNNDRDNYSPRREGDILNHGRIRIDRIIGNNNRNAILPIHNHHYWYLGVLTPAAPYVNRHMCNKCELSMVSS
jgi:hypothetical protein